MTDDVSVVLREIADLLRQRIEQSAEMAKQAAERMARIPNIPSPRIPDFATIEAHHQEAAKARDEEAARRRREDLEFRERLLAALERQNELIERLIQGKSL
jgi:hypothetical protein